MNKLTLNPDKMEVILVRKAELWKAAVLPTLLSLSNFVRRLGVLDLGHF